MRYITIILILNSTFLFSQNNDTIYFDNNWKLTNSDKFKYYRLYENTDSVLKIIDYYKNGNLQSIIHSESDVEKLMTGSIENKTGSCIFFDKNGRKRIMEIYKPLLYLNKVLETYKDTITFDNELDSLLIYKVFYYKNGNVKSHGFLYQNCDRHQVWKFYYKNGDHWITRIYMYGQIQSIKYYDHMSNLFLEKHYENEKCKSKMKFYQNGILHKIVLYENGKAKIKKKYYQNGDLKKQFIYK